MNYGNAMTYGSSLGISETSQCNTCLAGLNLVSVLDTKDVMCADCAETQYVNLVVKAHLTTDEAYDYYYKHLYLQIGDNTKARVDIPIATSGSVEEKRPLSIASEGESGHDWVGSVIKISERTKRYKVRAKMTEDTIREYLVIEEIDGDYRHEFLDPISNLTDRFMDLETSLTITPGETICPACHLVCNKHAVCPNCN